MAADPVQKTIYNDEPERRPAPITTTGVIGWVRRNLFATPLDTLLTFVSLLVIVSTLITLLGWAVQDANWYAITRNMNLFMVGALAADADSVLRVNIIVVLATFWAGLSIATWSRVNRSALTTLIATAVLLIAVPLLIDAAVPRPTAYLTAGDVELVAGTDANTPTQRVRFMGIAGETLTLRRADTLSSDEATLTSFAGFYEQATNTLVNRAASRVEAEARLPQIDTELAELDAALSATDLDPEARQRLERDRDNLLSEQERLSTLMTQTTPEEFALGAPSLRLAVLDESGAQIAEATLEPGSTEAFTLDLPADGWYVLEKQVTDGSGTVLIAAEGIYPNYDRDVIRLAFDENGEPILAVNGNQRTTTVTQYIRITDGYLLETAPVTLDDDGPPIADYSVLRNAYRGQRTLSDYVSMFIGPLFQQAANLLVPLILIFLLGAAAAQLTTRYLPRTPETNWPNRLVSIGWFLAPFIALLILSGTDAQRWGGLFLTFALTIVGIVLSFPLGVLMALGRRAEGWPAVQTAATIYIETIRGVPLITVLFIASLALPFISPALAEVPLVFRAMAAIVVFSSAYLAENVRGGLQSVPPGQAEAARALGMATWQITVFITLPQALRNVIPALVGQFIGLFKDTSLVAIIGLQDLTLIAGSVYAQAEYDGLLRETYLFISILYFIFSYVMSSISRRIEASGSGATRIQAA